MIKKLLSFKKFLSKRISTIKNQLIITFLLIIIIPTAIISSIIYTKSTESLTSKTENILEMNFNLLENNIQKEINLIDKVVTQIYLDDKMLDLLSYSPSKHYYYLYSRYKVIKDPITQSSAFENVLNTYTSTLNYFNKSKTKLYVYQFGDYKFHTNIFNLEEVQITSWYPSISPDSSPRIMYFPRSKNKNLPQGVNYVRKLFGLKNYDLSFSSLITIQLPMNEISRMLINLKPTNGSTIFVLNENNRIIASTENKFINANFKSFFSSYMPINDSNTFNTEIIDYNDTKTLLSTKTINDINWKIVGITPLNELNKDLYKTQKFIKLVILIILIISLSFALLLANRISNPIKKLVESMGTLDTDNLYVKIDDYHFNDEFSYLIDHYNAANKKIRNSIVKIKEIENEKKEAEFKALQAQINPHFLYNTLDAVNWLSLKYDAEDISIMVTSLSDFFRYSLSKGKTIIPLKNELIQTESYLTIQKIRFPDMIDYSIYCDEEIQECSIVKLTLQPLVENSIIHGIEPTDEPGFIEIVCLKEKNNIIITVSDNGIGADIDILNNIINDSSSSCSSYGLRNVNQRIKSYFGDTYGIIFSENETTGITATITLPFMIYEEDNNVKDDNC
ncbi:sensor histidine kinase [Vallitalea guaymasensis]|uniref:sensor histidine kinase n=1 Tax=Vallitalea guaymasensis TaxID=1185412 RepID=UPI00272A8FD4|nr:sensor histidine kinase [Vallitalea guaymasensis]